MDPIIAFFGGSTIFLAAVAWLIRSLTAHFLDKDAEKHKETLRAEVARSSRLHEERGVVLRDIYANLVELIDKTHSFVHVAEWSGEPTKDEKRKLVAEALIKFRDHFNKNKIYLSPNLCERIQKFSDNFIGPASKYALYLTWKKDDSDGELAKEFHQSWFSAFDKMEKEVPAALEALENEFRQILGTSAIDSNA